ncbi:hypothetical protein BDQ17DRAFT_1413581 [Cyathus striatus]|nr:hypothetical protein BDQ17DRAFT_1413581 [Cyathus striatus]
MPFFHGLTNATISGDFYDNSTSSPGDKFPGLLRLKEHVAVSNLHNSKDRYPFPQCHPETRVDIIQNLGEWVTSNRSGSVLLLEGSLGLGKSVIAQKICEIYARSKTGPRQLLASYFFSWRSESTSTPTSLIATIAAQIVAMIPEIEEFMEQSISEYRPDIFAAFFEDQVDVLLVKPIIKAVTELGMSSAPHLVVIDGLNECKTREERTMILRTICNAVTNNALPLRFLITTRPQPRLRSIVNNDRENNSILSLTDDATFVQDIIRYLRSELIRIREERELMTDWPQEEDVTALLNRSPGGFIYPFLLVKFIDLDDRSPQRQMELMLTIPIRGEPTSPFSACSNFATVMGKDHILHTITPDTISRPYHYCMINTLFNTDLPYLQEFVFSFLGKLSTAELRQVLMDVHSIYVPPCPY